MNAYETSVPADPRKARIEIIPLIDVIFFLLATFVLFTLSLQKIRSVEAPLAQADGRPREKAEDNLVSVTASADGTYFWRRGADPLGETLTIAELRPRLEEFRDSTVLPRVTIRSDRRATLGAAVLALDEVRRAGIRQVAVETVVAPSG